MKFAPSTWARVSWLASAALLASCGGGGSGDTTPAPSAIKLVASNTVTQHCAVPRSTDTLGTVANEKAWVRSWIDETYLWYPDVQGLSASTLNPNNYSTAQDFFAALKSPATTASGKPKDQYHFTMDTAAADAEFTMGQVISYGLEWKVVAPTPPRNIVVAYTTPGTGASMARGAQLLSVDGIDVVNDNTSAGVTTMVNGLFPSTAGTHTFRVLDMGATLPRDVTLQASALTLKTVQNVKTLPAPHQNVGYMQFNKHLETSEAELIAGINQLKSANVTDLVLDLRYNGGGIGNIASELAYMIAGPSSTSGKTFNESHYNDKFSATYTDAQRRMPFFSTTQGFSSTAGQALPSLGLSRVYVLTSSDTCSASELVINGLRGVGVQVHLIGHTTCGKPYGFEPTDNCGTTYFSINMFTSNQLGFGDYADGFAPTCTASDDLSHALGDTAEGVLKTALNYRDTGLCLPGMGLSKPQSVRMDSAPGGLAITRPSVQDNLILRRTH